MINRKKIAKLLYGTIKNSTSEDQIAFKKLSQICNWIQENSPSALYRFRSYKETTGTQKSVFDGSIIMKKKNDLIWSISLVIIGIASVILAGSNIIGKSI